MFTSGQFSQTLQPQQGFVSFFLGIANVADEIRLGLCALSRPVICRSGRGGTDQLPPDDLNGIELREGARVTNYIQRKLLGASLEVLHDSKRSGSHLSLLTSHFTVFTSGARP